MLSPAADASNIWGGLICSNDQSRLHSPQVDLMHRYGTDLSRNFMTAVVLVYSWNGIPQIDTEIFVFDWAGQILDG